jgi:RND superfamily putative drug exporter
MMANFLHKLGAYAFTHKWRIVGSWLLLLLILGVLAVNFSKPTSDAISIPGTEAQKALDRFGELFPDAGKGSARIVVEAPAGKTITDYQTQISTLVSGIEKVDGVSSAISPFVNTNALSSDKTIAYVQVQLKEESGAIKSTTISGIKTVADKARTNNLTVEMGGDVINKAPGEILGVGEIGGVVLALLVLIITLGSLVSAGMPIVVSIITIGVSMAGLFALSRLITISSTTPVLAIMLGLAVGIDYSLFIISKYRHYLLEGYSYKDAAAKAIGTAGNAVIFAAATVVIALSALVIVQIPFMATMGLAGAATVALAAITAVTLIPALLGIAGGTVFRGKTKVAIVKAQAKGPHESHHVSHATVWYRWGKAITKHPIVILCAAVLVIVTIALPVRSLTLGLPTDEYAATTTTQRKAYDLLSKGFGVDGPLLVVVEGLPAVTNADRESVRTPIMAAYNQQVAAATAAQQAVFQKRAATITTPQEYVALQQDIATAQINGATQQKAALAEIDQQVEKYAQLYQLNLVAGRVAKLDNVKQALPALTTDDGTKGIMQVISSSAPTDQKTLNLIAYLRSSDNQTALAGGRTATFGVTGSAALQSDINEKLAKALPEYLAVVVGLSLVLLIVAFRSILIPVKATLGFLLSVLAMFGALVAVFQWGWFGVATAPGPIVSFIPIIAIGILFGLAMDYEFFLVSSMHEAYGYSKDAKKAVVNGFGLGSKVVTAAGIIMVSVFAGFIFNHDTTVQAIGFGLAIGIFVDAFIVRMTIVPAVMTLLGKSAWWLPAWLDRMLPHVSIEGEEEVDRLKQ